MAPGSLGRGVRLCVKDDTTCVKAAPGEASLPIVV